MKKILLIQSLLLIPVVFVFWIVAYPETLQWMEEYSFFSTLPDFTHLQVRLPGDALPERINLRIVSLFEESGSVLQ